VEVPRVLTWRVVAAVEDQGMAWDFTLGERVGQPVGPDVAAPPELAAPVVKDAVSAPAVVPGPSPRPAGVETAGSVHVRPNGGGELGVFRSAEIRQGDRGVHAAALVHVGSLQASAETAKR